MTASVTTDPVQTPAYTDYILGECRSHLEHGLGVVKQLARLPSNIGVVEDLGVAAVRVPSAQLPYLR